MDYEKKYNEALERARKIHDEIVNNEVIGFPGQITDIFPELRESEDERIRKWLVALVENLGEPADEDAEKELEMMRPLALSYLEKQKEQNGEDEECTDFTIYHPLKNGEGKYECIPYSFYGSLTSFSEDKDLISFLRTCFYTKEECNEWIEKQKEQKPNIEICPHSIKSKSYKENGYPIENCDYGLEIALNILEKTLGKVQGFQTDDGIREHQTAIKAVKDAMTKQKPAEKQDYSGLNDLERAIHRGFLSAGVENVPVTIIKETAQECLAQMKPAEWSEEDERRIDAICELLENTSAIHPNYSRRKLIIWLKSIRPQPKVEWSEEDKDKVAQYLHDKDGGMLWAKATEITSNILDILRPRPSWKPSEEQMDALKELIDDANKAGWVTPGATELYEQLKKL